ncbi:MAG: peptidylprolyl isomerase [Luteibaculum sp.]
MKKSARQFLILALLSVLIPSQLYSQEEMKRPVVEISTNQGDIVIELFNETPKHRDNFLKLVNEGFYNGTLFHRVIKDFVIQGGDPESKGAAPDKQLGNGGPGYTIPAEINNKNFHVRGSLSAARLPDQINPEKESSGSQFYIVTGRKYNESDLQALEQRREQEMKNAIFNEILSQPENAEFRKRIELLSKVNNQGELQFFMKSLQPKVEEIYQERGGAEYSADQIKAYKEEGGTPHLDGGYTVFGRVLEGMDVVDKISAMETNSLDRPKEDVVMKKLKVIKR